MMSAWSALLVLSGKYDDLFNFVIFGSVDSLCHGDRICFCVAEETPEHGSPV